MSHTLIFYISASIFIYNSITGNTNMAEQSFRIVILLGFSTVITLLSKNK